MKKKDDPVVTKSILDERFEKFGRLIDENARTYRDQILNKMDEVVGELSQIRKDQVFMRHDIKDLQKRVEKLEQS